MKVDRYKAVFPELSKKETSEQLYLLIENTLQNNFGRTPDILIQRRIHEEWDAMQHHNMISAVAALYDLTAWLKSRRYPYLMKYTAGSCFILYLLGITSGNPLPYDFGGFDIPWQSHWGYGSSYTTLHMALPTANYQEIQEILPIILNKRFLLADHYRTQRNGQGIRQIHIPDVILGFELNENTVSAEFHEQNIVSSDHMMFLKNWKRYASYELMQRYSLPSPNDMVDLIALRGMGVASGAIDKDTAFLISKHNYNISDMIVFRDDVYSYLLSHGFSEEDAWRGSKSVGSGRGLPFITAEMEMAPDKWKLVQCQKARYLPSKAGIVEFLMYEYKMHTFAKIDK